MSFRSVLFCLCLATTIAGSLLLRPWNDHDQSWGSGVTSLTPGTQINTDIDAPGFLKLARYPSRLFAPDEDRASRPVFVLASAGLGRLLEPIIGPRKSFRLPENSYFWSYILINLLCLTSALQVFFLLMPEEQRYNGVTVGMGLLVVFTPLVQRFLWVPHTQIWRGVGPAGRGSCLQSGYAGATAGGSWHVFLGNRGRYPFTRVRILCSDPGSPDSGATDSLPRAGCPGLIFVGGC